MTGPQIVVAAWLVLWTAMVFYASVFDTTTKDWAAVAAVLFAGVSDVLIVFALHAGGFW